MLGTQATLPGQIKGLKLHKGQVWIGVIVLVALLGLGGWWSYQSGLLSQWLPASTSVTAAGGEIVIERAQTASVSAQPAAQLASTAAATQAAAVDETAVVAAATPAAATAGTTAAPVLISGVAGVNGTAVYADAGNVIGTLDSGARLEITASAAGGAWLRVETDTGAGWAQAAEVIAYGLGRLETVLLPGAVAAASAPAVEAVAESAPPATAATLTLAAAVTGTGSNLNVRSGPATDYAVVAKAPDGSAFQAVGRNSAGDWLLLQLSDDSTDVGWAAAQYIELGGDLQTLPVVDVTASA